MTLVRTECRDAMPVRAETSFKAGASAEARVAAGHTATALRPQVSSPSDSRSAVAYRGANGTRSRRNRRRRSRTRPRTLVPQRPHLQAEHDEAQKTVAQQLRVRHLVAAVAAFSAAASSSAACLYGWPSCGNGGGHPTSHSAATAAEGPALRLQWIRALSGRRTLA